MHCFSKTYVCQKSCLTKLTFLFKNIMQKVSNSESLLYSDFASFYKSYDCDYFRSCPSLQTLSRIPSRVSHFTLRPYFAPHSFSPYPNKKSVSFSLSLFLMSDINFHFSPLFQPSKSLITFTKSVLPTLTISMKKY